MNEVHRREFFRTAMGTIGALGTPQLPAAATGHEAMMWDYIVGSIRDLDEVRRRRLARRNMKAQPFS